MNKQQRINKEVERKSIETKKQAMLNSLRTETPPKARKIELVRVDAIDQLPGRRPINVFAVKALAESMARIGLQSPISIRYVAERRSDDGCDDSYVLVAGGHRLAAAKSLGWEKIETFVLHGVGDAADVLDQMLEISENLHRNDLTALDRDQMIAKWTRLKLLAAALPVGITTTSNSNQDRVLRQVAPKPDGGRPESGVRAAARELGIEHRDVRRADQVDRLSDEAKQAARDAGLDNNRSALLAAAKETTPEKQVEALVNRKPIDKGKLDRDLRLRAISEISLLINDHLPADMRICIRKNFEVLGSADGKAIATAIEQVEARRR